MRDRLERKVENLSGGSHSGRRTRRRMPPGRPLQGLGMRLRAARQQAGLSQAQLGSPFFTRAYISALELGKIQPSTKALSFLAERLSTSISYLISNSGPSERYRHHIAEAVSLIRMGRSSEAERVLDSLLRDIDSRHRASR